MYSMKSIGLSLLLAGMALFSSTTFVDAQVIAQAMVKPLSVRPGGRITATLNFVVSSFASNATDPAIAVGFATLGAQELAALNNKNRTTKGKASMDPLANELVIRGSRISPNKWRPKLRTNESEWYSVAWGIPKEGTLLKKVYKVVCKIRVGKGVESNTVRKVFVTLIAGSYIFDESLDLYIK